jgi:hypothetical protein
MFKVICIKRDTIDHDTQEIEPSHLVEGRVYTVADIYEKEWYRLSEIPPDKRYDYVFHCRNFIPLSFIDETEMEREYKTEKVC